MLEILKESQQTVGIEEEQYASQLQREYCHMEWNYDNIKT